MCGTERGKNVLFQSFWDKFEQTGSIKSYLDYVRNVKSCHRYDDDDWDEEDWDDWDDDDADYEDD